MTSTTLDLSGDVTREQYFASVEGLTEYLRSLAYDMSWCSERHRYFAAIIPEYDSYAGETQINRSLVPDDSDYAARLRDVRARVLWYVNAGTIELEYANRGFAAANMAPYVPEAKSGRRVQVFLPAFEFSVTDNGDTDAAIRVYVREHVTEMIVAALDNRTLEGNRYVPGSAVFEQTGIEVYVMRNDHNVIPSDMILRPSYL